ncbi:hypothetical protein ACCS42_09180 [Rhizobium ruizarguesonis]
MTINLQGLFLPERNTERRSGAHRTLVRTLSAILIIFTSGCASPPLEETRLFNESVLDVKSSFDPLLDDLSVAEKAQYASILDHNSKYPQRSLKAADAAYYATIGDGPSTGKIRASFAILVDYSATLVTLADGTAANQSKAQIADLAKNVSALVKVAELVPVVNELSPILDQALNAQSLEQQRLLIVKAAPAVKELVSALQDGIPVMYALLLWDIPVSTKPSAEQRKRVALARARLGDFAVMLDRISTSLDRLQIAVQHPGNPVTIASLAAAAGALDADVSAARKAYAQINANHKS